MKGGMWVWIRNWDSHSLACGKTPNFQAACKILYFPLFSTLLFNSAKVGVMPDDEIFTIKELAAYLKIAEKTAYRFVAEGRIPGFKVGGSWRFRKSEIDTWIREQEAKSKDEK